MALREIVHNFINKSNKPWCFIGLRDASQEQISEAIRAFRDAGIVVSHKTKGLPYNGVLRVRRL